MDRKRHTLQFKVQLREIQPLIWRRIEVPASYRFWDLHVAIQDAMGWLDYHLHAFRIRNPATGKVDEIGIPDDDPFEGQPEVLPGWETPVVQYLQRTGDRAEYEYDFGDGWEHDLLLEATGIRHAKTKYPRCLAGARRCPPEDCGGPSGYADLLTIVADPDHEEYESTWTWLGGEFDPEAFDPKRIHFDNPAKRWRIAFAGG
ncbi:MAG: plasmid pRiA4b ORF-3 family protein [Gemmataceae bacterium]|nr:plasmid pRiA4b ORF-3 family protein [Gemmataceae bacterium]